MIGCRMKRCLNCAQTDKHLPNCKIVEAPIGFVRNSVNMVSARGYGTKSGKRSQSDGTLKGRLVKGGTTGKGTSDD